MDPPEGSPTPSGLTKIGGMEYTTHFDRRFDRNRAPRLTFSIRMYVALLGFLVFALLYVAIGIRWHTYRARASLYAQQEIDSTFKAAEYLRAARNPGFADDAPIRAKEYRRLADMHTKAAEECTQLRQFYEQCW